MIGACLCEQLIVVVILLVAGVLEAIGFLGPRLAVARLLIKVFILVTAYVGRQIKKISRRHVSNKGKRVARGRGCCSCCAELGTGIGQVIRRLWAGGKARECRRRGVMGS
jgi:hypothetical protein